MHWLFDKDYEDENIVSYWVSTDYWDQSHLPEIKWIPVKALCTFDKNAKKVTFNHEKSDTQFFESKHGLLMVEARLFAFSRSKKGFPSMYHLATG